MRTDPSRFDRVLEHPDYVSAPNQPVLPADAAIGVATVVTPLALSIFGVMFLLIAITLIIRLEPPLAISLLFVGAALVVLFRGLAMGGNVIQFRNAPIERQVAVIVKERSEVSSTGNQYAAASTAYYTTLQTRNGMRSEYRTARSLVGRLAIDDIGVAYVKANTLVEFIRFDVD
jgi:hypothetical protein